MTGLVFVDTNVLLYAVDDADPAKQALARTWRNALWTARKGRISFQVLQEFYVNALQKWPSSGDHIRDEVRDLLEWRPVSVTADLLEHAWKIQDRYRFSFWDSLIVAAAKLSSCQYLLTEDLQTGQDVEGIAVVSPFLTEPSALP